MNSRAFPLLGLMLAVCAGVACADDAGEVAAPAPRRVMGLYDGTDFANPADNPLQSRARAILEHLGFTVELHDLATGLPPPDQLADCGAVLAWFIDDELPGALAFAHWLPEQVRAGRKVILWGTIGFLEDHATHTAVSPVVVHEALAALGLDWHEGWTANPLGLETVRIDADMVGCERKPAPGLSGWVDVQPLDPDAPSFAEVRRSDAADRRSHPVLITRAGGFVHESFLLYSDVAAELHQWILDPFRYLARALDAERTPRMDVTTRNGRRLLVTHIDGDGFHSVSELDGESLCAEIIRDRVLKRYPIPTTVSVVIGELLTGNGDPDHKQAIARSILELPHVEPASHGYAHPLEWANAKVAIEGIPGFVYDDRAEVREAVAFMRDRLCPPGKTVDLFLWTGDCEPTEAAIAEAERLQLRNMNGGGTRMDDAFPSLTSLRPLARRVGAFQQVLAPNLNENEFTGLWRGPFYGYRHAIRTFERTGTPRRLRPMNIYYHFFSGEKTASLKALCEVYDWALAQHPCAITAREYVDIVRGFQRARVTALGADAWSIRDYGACRTVRFDQADRTVDLARSQGVLGFTRESSCLYVHLAPADEARIHLSPQAAPAPHVDRACADVRAFAGDANGFHLQADGRSGATIDLAGFPPNTRYTLEWSPPPASAPSAVTTDAAGTLHLDVPPNAGLQVRGSRAP